MLLEGTEGSWHLGEGSPVPQGSGFVLDDRQIVPPVVDRLALAIMRSDKGSAMLADRVPLGDDDDPVGIDAQADGSIGEGRRHAVSIALQMNQAGWRHPFGVLDEAVEGAGHRHKVN